MLSHVVHADVHQFYGVQCTSTAKRLGRSMRGDAAELELDVDDGLGRSIAGTGCVAGMPREDDIIVTKEAITQHVDLADARFLGRRAVELYRALQLSRGNQVLQRNGRGCRAHTEHRVTAGVPCERIRSHLPLRHRCLGDARQGVVFSEQSDHRPPRTIARGKRRRHTRHAGLDFEAIGFE